MFRRNLDREERVNVIDPRPQVARKRRRGRDRGWREVRFGVRGSRAYWIRTMIEVCVIGVQQEMLLHGMPELGEFNC